MDRSTFWTGYCIYAVIQGLIIVARLVKLIEVSWWLIFIPTFVIFFGGLFFIIYLSLAYNLRIEKDDD